MDNKAKISIHNMDLYYGDFHALKNINMELPEKEISAFIGPSGCGKSTLGRTLIRIYDPTEGKIILNGKDISGKISELSDMMPELEGKKGILYLDTYDPVNPPSMYTMKRKP